MFRSYKIYYNDAYALLTGDHSQINENFDKVIEEEKELTDFINNPDVFFQPGVNTKILLLSPKPDKAMDKLVAKLKIVHAAGGIVFNEFDELLMIFRRGKWDLPKGKLDKGENIAECAQREVEEETGVKISALENVPIVTWHAYVLKGAPSIKRTEWFIMKAKPGQKTLVPQTEEDIEEARWVKRSELKKYKDISFPLVWNLIQVYTK